MRAEEGDESVKDYAAEGKQALGRIKDAQRAGSPLGRILRRVANIFRGERDRPGGGEAD
ncbi:hypothetical protein BN973_05405 [Mycobacterium numidiamassiliense]|uniref:Uncharacterized protein n=1 Tax=Mycobacterium numidiamassiliense TaxID=1841861 RepID=A0A2U3P8U7_9MYCO|nr:hypothetical protein [Mycobacterium numidiamassiliense]SPM40179.1 hypothetical protein BN973_05405 [Mycobacterium numidiamassiliense]